MAAELELLNSVLVGVAVVGCEPVGGRVCAVMNGQDLTLVPLWEKTDLPAEGHKVQGGSWTSEGGMDSW